MKYFLIFHFVILFSCSLQAHPGIGIVKDSKGNIYYTDLEQVWKITPDGKKAVIVNNVHTHELYLDASDDLYGEHVWYNGETLHTWEHYTWCLRHTGKLDTIIKPTEGLLTDYSFVRDAAGNMYWVQRFTISKFKKKASNGQVTTIAEGKFKNIRWMHATKNGILYFIDITDLYKLENGQFKLLAKDLYKRTSGFEYGSLEHNVYGIWTGPAENIYVAVVGGQVVKKITAAGKISDFVYSAGTWRPNSGLFDDAGNLWLLESNIINEVRVRKIEQKDIAGSPIAFYHSVRKAIALIIAAFIFVMLAWFIFKLSAKFYSKTLKQAYR